MNLTHLFNDEHLVLKFLKKGWKASKYMMFSRVYLHEIVEDVERKMYRVVLGKQWGYGLKS